MSIRSIGLLAAAVSLVAATGCAMRPLDESKMRDHNDAQTGSNIAHRDPGQAGVSNVQTADPAAVLSGLRGGTAQQGRGND